MNGNKKECPHCYQGSGKLIGHGGRHKLFTPEESKKRFKKRKAATRVSIMC